MIAPKPLPAAVELHAVFEYKADNGSLYWRYRADQPKWWNARFAGKPAGYKRAPRKMVTINYQRYFVSRIIFKMLHGFDPLMVDHRNRDKTDNRAENLRAATRSQNAANSHARTRPKHNLPRGVFVSSSKSMPYRARVGNHHLGMFATVAAAKAAFETAARATYGDFSNV